MVPLHNPEATLSQSCQSVDKLGSVKFVEGGHKPPSRGVLGVGGEAPDLDSQV